MTPDDDLYISANVRAEIARGRMSHRSVSDQTGIAYSRLQRRLRKGEWRVRELDRIAEVLGIDLGSLIRRT